MSAAVGAAAIEGLIDEYPGNLPVLVVDDDELIRVAISTLLSAFGYQVRSAEGGLEALEQLESGYEPDVVILDVNMPGLSGPDTLTSLLALRPSQYVLLASGYGDEEMARAVSGRPNVSSIRKPFTLDELEAKLGEWRLRPPEFEDTTERNSDSSP